MKSASGGTPGGHDLVEYRLHVRRKGRRKRLHSGRAVRVSRCHGYPHGWTLQGLVRRFTCSAQFPAMSGARWSSFKSDHLVAFGERAAWEAEDQGSAPATPLYGSTFDGLGANNRPRMEKVPGPPLERVSPTWASPEIDVV